MISFVQKLENAIQKRENAKKFAKTRRHALLRQIGHGDVAHANVIALTILTAFFGFFLYIGLFLLAKYIHSSLLMFITSTVAVLTIISPMLFPIIVSEWSSKSMDLCLTHENNPDVSPKNIVKIIQSYQKAGATEEQLVILQVCAKDLSLPVNWWDWLDNAAKIELFEQQEREKEELLKRQNQVAQQLINHGKIV